MMASGTENASHHIARSLFTNSTHKIVDECCISVDTVALQRYQGQSPYERSHADTLG